MSRANSFTSNSDPAPGTLVADATPGAGLPAAETTGPGRRRAIRDLLALVGWTVAWLIAFDLLVGVVANSSRTPAKIRAFFTYGHSIRWKLQEGLAGTRLMAAGFTETFANNGWLEPPLAPMVVRQSASDLDPVVSFYGNSYSERVANAMIRTEPRVSVRALIGFNSSPNHSYAAFHRDPARARSKVAVLGVVSSNINGVLSRGYTSVFDFPPAYTQPLMRIQDGRLVEEWPRVLSLEECRKCLFDDERWKQFSDEMAPWDPYFDHFLFDGSVADRSVIGCLIRKAWAQYRAQQVQERTLGPNGFIRDSQVIRVLSMLLVKFADEARAQGSLPIVLLLDSAGMQGRLKEALGDSLTAAQVPFISSSDLFRTNDRRNYIPDGHYTEENDEKVAKAILDLMRNPPKFPR